LLVSCNELATSSSSSSSSAGGVFSFSDVVVTGSGAFTVTGVFVVEGVRDTGRDVLPIRPPPGILVLIGVVVCLVCSGLSGKFAENVPFFDELAVAC